MPGWCLFGTPVGSCGLAWDAPQRLVACRLPEPEPARLSAWFAARWGEARPAPPPVQAWIERLLGVMAGALDTLADVPLADEAHPALHRQVWALARQIPPGQTRTYGDLAQALGQPGAARAVGRALGANPFAPVVPCHRVMAAGGAAGGFSAPGGLATKLQLLQLEGARWGDTRQTPLF